MIVETDNKPWKVVEVSQYESVDLDWHEIRVRVCATKYAPRSWDECFAFAFEMGYDRMETAYADENEPATWMLCGHVDDRSQFGVFVFEDERLLEETIRQHAEDALSWIGGNLN